MYCENCGAFVPEDSKFCPECGKEISSEPKPAVLRCPNCGTENEPDALFCEDCGHKLSGQQSAGKDIPPVPERPRSTYIPPAPSAISEQPRTSSISPAPPAPVRPRETVIPSAPHAAVRETGQTKVTKPKKKSGCGAVVLILLILLVLAAAYYFLKVYDGDPNSPIGRVIYNVRPTAESVITKLPETISDISTKIPETISDFAAKVPDSISELTVKPTSTAASVSNQTVATAIPVIPPASSNAGKSSQTNIPKPTAGKAYDPARYSTTEMSRLQDFLWVTQDIAHGSLPAGNDRLTSFDELLGVWKAWIIDDLNGQYGSGIERLCSVNFVKDANGNGMTFNWFYVHNTKIDEGYDDNTPPTTFYGEMQNGRFYGLGTGSVDMPDFYVLNGHEYAVGTLHWPDGIQGTVFLVRP